MLNYYSNMNFVHMSADVFQNVVIINCLCVRYVTIMVTSPPPDTTRLAAATRGEEQRAGRGHESSGRVVGGGRRGVSEFCTDANFFPADHSAIFYSCNHAVVT